MTEPEGEIFLCFCDDSPDWYDWLKFSAWLKTEPHNSPADTLDQIAGGLQWKLFPVNRTIDYVVDHWPVHAQMGGANKGLYIIGDPRNGPTIKLLWGLPVVESDSIAAGSFLLGAFSTAVELIDRQQAFIEVSYENGTNFIQNIVTILCEERVGMAVRRAEALIYGHFS